MKYAKIESTTVVEAVLPVNTKYGRSIFNLDIATINTEFGIYEVVEASGYDANLHNLLPILTSDLVDNVFTQRFENKTPVQLEELAKISIINKYDNIHTINGLKYYSEFRADLIIDITKGTITEPDAILIGKVLKNAFLDLRISGDWKSAEDELLSLTGITSLVQPYYDDALLQIQTYITTNYS